MERGPRVPAEAWAGRPCHVRAVRLNSPRGPPPPNPKPPPRFLVGIDLGTTNSAVAFVDTAEKAWAVHDFPVPQLVGPGLVEPRATLPSFHYESAAGEFPAGALTLPWSGDELKVAVGAFARDHGSAVPGAARHVGQILACPTPASTGRPGCCRGTGRPTSTSCRRSTWLRGTCRTSGPRGTTFTSSTRLPNKTSSSPSRRRSTRSPAS